VLWCLRTRRFRSSSATRLTTSAARSATSGQNTSRRSARAPGGPRQIDASRMQFHPPADGADRDEVAGLVVDAPSAANWTWVHSLPGLACVTCERTALASSPGPSAFSDLGAVLGCPTEGHSMPP
jgi:hypothetical protein